LVGGLLHTHCTLYPYLGQIGGLLDTHCTLYPFLGQIGGLLDLTTFLLVATEELSKVVYY
jgi:hypothetical protein